MSNSLQTSFNSVMVDLPDKYHVLCTMYMGYHRKIIIKVKLTQIKTRNISLLKATYKLCYNQISFVYIFRVISSLMGFTLLFHLHTKIEYICRWKFTKK